MSKEPDGVLVMTTCKCREHGTNLVMTRTFFDERLESKILQGVRQERERIIELLENTFYPLDYGRWQADELLDEVIAVIKAGNDD